MNEMSPGQSLRPGALLGPMQDRAVRLLSTLMNIERQHRGESGRRREDDVRDFLRAFLPGRLAVDTGEIVASDGTTSPQIDVIVYDALETPLLDRSEASVVVPVEGVYGVIEISTNLDGPKLQDDVEKIRRVKAMPKRAYFRQTQAQIQTTHFLWGREYDHFPVLGYCFAYDSVGLDTLSADLDRIDDRNDPSRNVDMICSLAKGCVANGVPATTLDGAPTVTELNAFPTPSNVRFKLASGVGEEAQALMLFYLLGCSVLVQARTAPIRMALYMHSRGAPAN